MSEPRPACQGRSDLFDSTDPRDHAVAAGICAGCPVRDWCAGELRKVQAAATRSTSYTDVGPQGTWAGMLVGPSRNRRREVA